MTYQLLVATINQNDTSIIDNMNINSDAIIVNQSDCHKVDHIQKDAHNIKMFSFKEKGVGLNRNTALMRADADIVEFADDDMIFTDTYKEDVLNEFIKHPQADAILFSVNSLNPQRPLLKIKKFGRVFKFGALKYGCARLAVRREKLEYNNVTFSLLFGGGAKYGSGEDTLFLQDCIRAGLKIYKSPVKVADITQEESTWFKGYSQRYYMDKGALFAAALPWLCYLYALLSAIKSSNSEFGKLKIFSFYLKGIYEFKKKQ